MGYTNVQADVNFYRQSLNADGIKDVTGPYTSLYEDVFRAITVTTDSVVSVTSYVGDSLSSQFLFAGTEIYGLFSSVTIHSGNAILHLAGASYISEIVNQYSASGIPLGFYEEGTQCLSQKISALLTQGVFDDASWVMVPSQYEEDWVRAFKPTSELGNLAFTRSSDATFTDSTGVVRRSPWNLVTFSEQFDNAIWSKSGVTVTANTTISPSGTLTADTVTENSAATTQHRLTQSNVPCVLGVSYTVSAYVKRGVGTRNVQLGGFGTASWIRVYFNLSDGTVGAQVAGTGTITSVGDGWYRITATGTSDLTGNNILFLANTNGTTSGSETYTGDGVSSIVWWGAQFVEGAEALPYFATTDRLNVPRLDYSNADGTLSTCPRLLLEPQRTNSIRNSSMVGAVAGTPGTAPTNWSTGNAGLTRTIIGTGTENGLPYIDVRFNGTATGPLVNLNLEGTQVISATTGQTWTTSIWSKIVANSSAGSISYLLSLIERNSFGAYLVDYAQTFTNTTTLQRFSFVRATANASTAFVQPGLYISITNGAAYDFTIRIAAPQMELGAYATTWVPTTTTAVTRIADTFTRNNIYTNGLISAAGGTWIVDLSNNLSLTRDGASTSLSISTLSSDVFAGANGFEIRGAVGNRFEITKRISGTATLLFTTTTSNVKIAIKWNGTTADVFVNGVKQVSATAFTTTVMEFLKSFGADVPKYINQSLLAPSPLTDSECIALTTL